MWRSSDRVCYEDRMRNATIISQTVLLALLGFACGDSSSETTAMDPPVCDEPAFIEGLPVDFAPCGCGTESPWAVACQNAEPPYNPTHTCYFAFDEQSQVLGGTCLPLCVHRETQEPLSCPPLDMEETECRTPLCRRTCTLDAECPAGMTCFDNTCIHSFPVEPTS